MKRLFRRLIIALAIMILAAHPSKAGPFADFFKAVRHSITHPEQKSRVHHTTHKNSSETTLKEAPASDHAASNGTVAAPPSTGNTRSATGLSKKSKTKNDLHYGTPVPGKQGFVTSPFAPESGYIDVRGFPPGTEVKDPYSGKTFLTP
jgi:hypothetical protein